MAYEKAYEAKRKLVEDFGRLCVQGESSEISGFDYARKFITGEEFVRVRKRDGEVKFINVTGNSMEAILIELARYINLRTATGLVISSEGRKYAAEFFA